MTQENMQFEFQGFNPDPNTRTLISTIAERIHLNAPSDSALKLALLRGKDAIRVSCRIVSRVGTFVAEAVSDSPRRALKQVEQKMRVQLDQWKSWRFQNKLNKKTPLQTFQ